MSDIKSQIEAAELTEAQLRIERLQLENQAIKDEAGRPFWDIRARGLLQAGIAGIVAGALIFGFLLDNYLKIDELETRTMEVETIIEGLRREETAIAQRNSELEIRRVEMDRQQADYHGELSRQKAEVDLLVQNAARLKAEIKELEGARVQDSGNATSAVDADFKAALEDVQSRVSEVTDSVVERAEGLGNIESSYFPIIASVPLTGDIVSEYVRMQTDFPDLDLQIYDNGRDYYAITLGGYLTAESARQRVEIARQAGVKDAYSKIALDWGEDLTEALIGR